MEKYGYDLRFCAEEFKIQVYDQYLLSRRLGEVDIVTIVRQLNNRK